MACSSNRQNRFISLTKLAKFSPSQNPYQDHPITYVDGRMLVKTEVEWHRPFAGWRCQFPSGHPGGPIGPVGPTASPSPRSPCAVSLTLTSLAYVGETLYSSSSSERSGARRARAQCIVIIFNILFSFLRGLNLDVRKKIESVPTTKTGEVDV